MGVFRNQPDPPPPEIIDLTETDMQRALAYQYGTQSLAASVNVTLINNSYWESDFFRITHARFTYEYEIKRSVSDFKRDFTHKIKHRFYADPMLRDRIYCPNYFYFVVSESLKEKIQSLIPNYAGLIIVSPIVKRKNRGKPVCGITIIIDAPRLHAEKATDEMIQKTLRDAMFRLMKRI